MASSKKLLHNGLNEQKTCTETPAQLGMDNMSDKKNQKPLPNPKSSVTEKSKNFTMC